MFTSEKINKIKLESIASLKSEFETLSKEKKIPPEWKKIFSKYSDLNSAAGMETWLNSYFVYHYFADIELEWKKVESKSQEKITEFHSEILNNLLNDFREEDFQFLEWERLKVTKKNISTCLKTFKSKSLKDLTKTQKKFIPGYYLNTYEYAPENPSKAGVDLQLKTGKTPIPKIEQAKNSIKELELFWKEGFDLFSTLTDTILIVQSDGLVSYSHFTEPGVSYINFIDRDLLDSIDDLIHENAHHHLNLLLKKYRVFKKDDFDTVYYSPWRRELRSLYGIYHASFTFSYGAMLFYHIFTSEKKDRSILTERDFLRAKSRFAEETLMLNYSLEDLQRDRSGLTSRGQEILDKLLTWNEIANHNLKSVLKDLRRTEFDSRLKELDKLLKKKRKEYKNLP